MKVMVVDDDATNRIVLKGMLEKESYQVICAEDGVEAVELFTSEQPELILMDVMMPNMDGYEATRIIKSRCGDRFVPVIFLTAIDDDEALVRSIEFGADDFMTKPYKRNVLNAKIAAFKRIQGVYDTVRDQQRKLLAFQEHTMREHEVAERIFTSIIREGDLDQPFIRNFRRSAEAFNGDIVLAARNPCGGMNLLIGDFTGHGLAAAIGALPVAEVFYRATADGYTIEEMLPELNKGLKKLLPVGRFLAACLIHLDAQCRFLQIWNGGMPEVLIADPAKGEILTRVPSERVPLGVLDSVDLEVEARNIEINDGYRLYVFSDGVVETENAEGEMFGQQRLDEIILASFGSGDLIGPLLDELDTYRGEGPQVDDITILTLDCDRRALLSLADDKAIPINNNASAWCFEIELLADTLKRFDPLPLLMQSLGEIQGMQGHRENFFTILSELYNNALDHGLLGMDSSIKKTAEGFYQYYAERQQRLMQLDKGFIRLQLNHLPTEDGGQLSIIVEDSGPGFVPAEISPKAEVNLSNAGRGLLLVRSLCSSLSFSETGNTVTAVYDWQARSR